MQIGYPLGPASLTAALKAKGIEVKIFDTVFYRFEGELDINDRRAEMLHSVRPVDYSSVGIHDKLTGPMDDLTKLVKDFDPDLIGLTAIESVFARGLELVKCAKKAKNVPAVAGGVFATLAPDIVINEPAIDMVCIGEGEDVICEVAGAMASGRDYTGIKGLWAKKGKEVVKNGMMPLKGLDEVPEPDFSAFDPLLIYRPMQGKLFRTVPVELSRGCPFMCTYCAEPALNGLYRKNGEKGYFRKKSIPKVLGELERTIKEYNPEFFYFATETFLAMTDAEFEAFVEGYRRIKLPFWIQTRVETITRKRIEKLKEVGLYWLTIGIEHGNEEYRKKYLKRHTKNSDVARVIKILDDAGMGASLNNIIGFPFETKELIRDTIDLNHELFSLNNRLRFNVSLFTPFRGCELYDLCVSNGMMEPVPYITHHNISDGSLVRSDFITAEELDGLFRTFNLYVYLPDSYNSRIREAEKFTEKGNGEFNALNAEVEKYLK